MATPAPPLAPAEFRDLNAQPELSEWTALPAVARQVGGGLIARLEPFMPTVSGMHRAHWMDLEVMNQMIDQQQKDRRRRRLDRDDVFPIRNVMRLDDNLRYTTPPHNQRHDAVVADHLRQLLRGNAESYTPGPLAQYKIQHQIAWIKEKVELINLIIPGGLQMLVTMMTRVKVGDRDAWRASFSSPQAMGAFSRDFGVTVDA